MPYKKKKKKWFITVIQITEQNNTYKSDTTGKNHGNNESLKIFVFDQGIS